MGCGGSVVQQEQIKIIPNQQVDNKEVVTVPKDNKINSGRNDKANKPK